MTPSTPSDTPGPHARGARLAAIRSINDDAILVSRAEDSRRRGRRAWWWLGGATLGLALLGALALVQGLVLRASRRAAEEPIVNRMTSAVPAGTVSPSPRAPGRNLGQAADVAGDIAALSDPDPQVRRAAAGRLGGMYPIGKYDPAAIGNALLKALKDPDEGVRIEAAASLATASGQFSMLRVQDPRAQSVATDALLQLLLDDRPKVREAALLALDVVLPDPETVERVKPLLKEDDPAVRMAAAVLIVRLGEGELAVDTLADAYDLEQHRFPSKVALEHLQTLGQRMWGTGTQRQGPVRAALVDGLTEPDRPTRRAAALGLADLGRMDFDSDTVADGLAAVLRHSPDPVRRGCALDQLRSIAADTPSVRDALRAAASDPRLDAAAAGHLRALEQRKRSTP
jgi:HEAT repeat protein